MTVLTSCAAGNSIAKNIAMIAIDVIVVNIYIMDNIYIHTNHMGRVAYKPVAPVEYPPGRRSWRRSA